MAAQVHCIGCLETGADFRPKPTGSRCAGVSSGPRIGNYSRVRRRDQSNTYEQGRRPAVRLTIRSMSVALRRFGEGGRPADQGRGLSTGRTGPVGYCGLRHGSFTVIDGRARPRNPLLAARRELVREFECEIYRGYPRLVRPQLVVSAAERFGMATETTGTIYCTLNVVDLHGEVEEEGASGPKKLIIRRSRRVDAVRRSPSPSPDPKSNWLRHVVHDVQELVPFYLTANRPRRRWRRRARRSSSSSLSEPSNL